MKMHLYADESRQTNEKFMLIGGIWIPKAIESAIIAEIESFRQNRRMFATLKWTKVSNQKLGEYIDFVGIFKKFYKNRALNFNCIKIDSHKTNYKKYCNNDKELGFYKFYQFWIEKFSYPKNNHYLFLHQRQNRHQLRLLNLQSRLNSNCYRKHKASAFKTIEPRSIEKCDILQLVDVILGAIGYKFNNWDKKPNAKLAKSIVASMVRRMIAKGDVWRFRLKK